MLIKNKEKKRSFMYSKNYMNFAFVVNKAVKTLDNG
jgi:hypothetical protein